MNICRSPTLADSTGSEATSLDAGSKDSDCEPRMVGPALKLSPRAMSASGPADSPEPISGFGTARRRPASSTECATQGQGRELPGPFAIQQSGNAGQHILDHDGMSSVGHR